MELRMLTNKAILDLAESVGFEYNDFGRWNCTEDAILELAAEIERHYGVAQKQHTDVMRTFRKHGFVPPSTLKDQQ
jgi:hypothetical protein